MTNEQIKKALACCCECEANCDNCPNAKIRGYGCKDKLISNALNLIAEQEKEIELLKMQLQDAVNHGNTFLEEANKFETENKRLKKEIDFQVQDRARLQREIDELEQAKIDVLTELKEKYGFYSCYSWNCDVKSLSEIIDDMIEELKKNDTL